MSGVGIPKEGTCEVFPEISRRQTYGDILRSSFLFLSSEFASVEGWFFFFYGFRHLHSKYFVYVSQCIHSEVLKMKTKTRQWQRTCHKILFFTMIIPWNQKRAAASLHLLHAASPWESASLRINFSLGIWLQISILLNQEEFILLLLLWLCMVFWLHKESCSW